MANQHDIDEVLSSIRRLVANESNGNAALAAAPADPEPDVDPEPEAAPPEEASETQPAEPASEASAVVVSALVLAPDQRVTDPEDPFQMIKSLAQEERDGRDAEHFLTAVDDKIAAITTDIEIPGAVDDVFSAIADPVTVDATDVDPLPEDYREDTDYQATDVHEDLEQAIFEDMQSDEATLPPTSPEQPFAMEEVLATASIDDEAPTDADVDDGDWQGQMDMADAAQDAFAEDLATDPVPAVPLAEDEDASALWGQDQGEAAFEPKAPRADPADKDEIDLSDLSETVGGEEALRELIAEVVRQELAGALGERITRNVRKLVRREIRSLMTSGEFD